jgi:hypothetical protein
MAGLLARITGGDDDSNLLGLSSRYKMPADVRAKRDHEVGVSIARVQVIETDVRGVEHIGTVAIQAMANISDLAERAAMRAPEERSRVDSVADNVALVLNRKLMELGGQ